jgi:hypothetical protein
MFRALTTEKEVFGWLFKCNEDNEYYILSGELDGDLNLESFKVTPETIAMETGQTDKNGTMIYGSFNLKGFGMTKGGDVVRGVSYGKYFDEPVEKSAGGFIPLVNLGDKNIQLSEPEIIGKQYENNK